MAPKRLCRNLESEFRAAQVKEKLDALKKTTVSRIAKLKAKPKAEPKAWHPDLFKAALPALIDRPRPKIVKLAQPPVQPKSEQEREPTKAALPALIDRGRPKIVKRAQPPAAPKPIPGRDPTKACRCGRLHKAPLKCQTSTRHAAEFNPGPEQQLLPQPVQLHIGQFEILEELGHGTWGHVYLARHRVSRYVCALKALEKSQVTKNRHETFLRRELEIHQNLAHPNILRLLAWFHDETKIFLVLEYAVGGDLNEHREKQPDKQFKEDVAACYIAQVAEALKYMHSKNIMHRDIKPENILLGLHGEVKLADFGYSVHSLSNRRTTVCGTPAFVPPEIARMIEDTRKSRKEYDRSVDVWSLGVLAFDLMTGRLPFSTVGSLTQWNGKLRIPEHISKEGQEFILQLMHLDAEKRLSLDQVIQHPWIRSHCENKV